MVDENNLHEVELLTKRFMHYIDKVQAMLETVQPVFPKTDDMDENGKFYTVISPIDAMSVNVQSVKKAIEDAIRNIEDLSGMPVDNRSTYQVEKKGESGGNGRSKTKLFSNEELKFLEETFNRILKSSVRERTRIFENLAKSGDTET